MKKLDTLGMRCPLPVVKIAGMLPKMDEDEILEVTGDCPTFEEDIRKWCERYGKTLLAVNHLNGAKVCQIQF